MDTSIISERAIELHKKLDREVELLKLRLAVPYRSDVRKWFEACGIHFRHFHTELRRHMEMEEEGWIPEACAGFEAHPDVDGSATQEGTPFLCAGLCGTRTIY